MLCEVTFLRFAGKEYLPLPAEFGCRGYAVLQLEGWNYAQGQRNPPKKINKLKVDLQSSFSIENS